MAEGRAVFYQENLHIDDLLVIVKEFLSGATIVGMSAYVKLDKCGLFCTLACFVKQRIYQISVGGFLSLISVCWRAFFLERQKIVV
jgi:hypothetical protein